MLVVHTVPGLGESFSAAPRCTGSKLDGTEESTIARGNRIIDKEVVLSKASPPLGYRRAPILIG